MYVCAGSIHAMTHLYPRYASIDVAFSTTVFVDVFVFVDFDAKRIGRAFTAVVQPRKPIVLRFIAVEPADVTCEFDLVHEFVDP